MGPDMPVHGADLDPFLIAEEWHIDGARNMVFIIFEGCPDIHRQVGPEKGFMEKYGFWQWNPPFALIIICGVAV